MIKLQFIKPLFLVEKEIKNYGAINVEKSKRYLPV